MANFLEKLDSIAERNKSLLCVGLDPTTAQMPIRDVSTFCTNIIDATKDLVCAFKPNIAFFEALGLEGLHALEKILASVPSEIPIILDAKRGDIGSTASAYAHAAFEVWGADAVTVSPYLGYDSIEPFLEHEEKCIFLLCRTSNPGGSDFQSLSTEISGSSSYLYEHIAMKAKDWNVRKNIGLVVGATVPDELARIRGICPDMPLLIPGVGAQGGDIKSSVENGSNLNGRRAIINSSRQILYASRKTDYAQAARIEAEKLRQHFNLVLEDIGLGW